MTVLLGVGIMLAVWFGVAAIMNIGDMMESFSESLVIAALGMILFGAPLLVVLFGGWLVWLGVSR